MRSRVGDLSKTTGTAHRNRVEALPNTHRSEVTQVVFYVSTAPTQHVRLSGNLNEVRSFTASRTADSHAPPRLWCWRLRLLLGQHTVLKLTSPERTSTPETPTSIADQIQLSQQSARLCEFEGWPAHSGAAVRLRAILASLTWWTGLYARRRCAGASGPWSCRGRAPAVTTRSQVPIRRRLGRRP